MEYESSLRSDYARETTAYYDSFFNDAAYHAQEIMFYHDPTYELRLNPNRELEVLSYDKVLREDIMPGTSEQLIKYIVDEVEALNDQRFKEGFDAIRSLTDELKTHLQRSNPTIDYYDAVESADTLHRIEDQYADAYYRTQPLDLSTGATYEEYLEEHDPDAAPIPDYDMTYTEIMLHTSDGTAKAFRLSLITFDVDQPLKEVITLTNLNDTWDIQREVSPSNPTRMGRVAIADTILCDIDKELQYPSLDDIVSMNDILYRAE